VVEAESSCLGLLWLKAAKREGCGGARLLSRLWSGVVSRELAPLVWPDCSRSGGALYCLS
jgi:hypothetical protein